MFKSAIFFALFSLVLFQAYSYYNQLKLEVSITKPSKEQIEISSKWPIWEKEISEFDYSYDKIEQCLILEGEVDIFANNKKWSFTKGDFVVFPKGFKCKWVIKKPVKKHYNFIE
jgi:uncharacterized cupin superfamily protein